MTAFAHRAAQRDAVRRGHHHIENGHVDITAGQGAFGLHAVGGLGDRHAVAFEVAADHLTHYGVVIGAEMRIALTNS